MKYINRTSDVYAYDQSIKSMLGVVIIRGDTSFDDKKNIIAYIFLVKEVL